eukprot:m.219808 g.219808  ORF g.219808 m.219808 type:complete len:1401 (-) comp15917_c1_seq1:95-4297(-)
MSSSSDKKAERLVAAARKYAELQTSQLKKSDGVRIPAHELPIFKWLNFQEGERKQLLDLYQQSLDREDNVTLKLIPEAQSRVDKTKDTYKLIQALAKNHPDSKSKQGKALIRRITEGSDITQQVQSFVKNTSLAFSPKKLMSEVSTAIEVFQSELLFRKRAAARETEKKLDTEHIIADRKHQRLVNKLTNEEDVLFEQLLVGREYQRRMGDSEQGMEQAWSILSKAPLRRLVFAKIDQQQAVNEYSVLVAEQHSLPQRRAQIQSEVAAMAKKEYRNLARKYHADKGGDSEKFEQIKLGEKILTDTGHTANPEAPNLMLKYIQTSSHDTFLTWFKNYEAQQSTQQSSGSRSARKQESGSVSKQQSGSRKPRLAIESGTPPKCKMPRVDYRLDDAQERIKSKADKTIELLINWGPAHSRATHFELQKKVGNQGKFVTLANECTKDYFSAMFNYPGLYLLRVRAMNELLAGEYSNDVKFELDKDGNMLTANDLEANQQKHNEEEGKKKKLQKTAERELKKAVEKANEKLAGTLHSRHRPQVIEELKSALLQHRGHCVNEGLKTEAKDILVHLRRKELTQKWRQELKAWAEQLVEDHVSDDELELEIRVRIQALDPERLNWFYQHILTRCSKIIESYKGTLDRMPLSLRPAHRRFELLISMVLLNSDNMKTKLREDFHQRKEALQTALERSVQLEEQKVKDDEAAAERAMIIMQEREQEEQARRLEAIQQEEKRMQERIAKEKERMQANRRREQEELEKKQKAEEERLKAEEKASAAAEEKRKQDELAMQQAALRRAEQAKRRAEQAKATTGNNTQNIATEPNIAQQTTIKESTIPPKKVEAPPQEDGWAASSMSMRLKAKQLSKKKQNANKNAQPLIGDPPKPTLPPGLGIGQANMPWIPPLTGAPPLSSMAPPVSPLAPATSIMATSQGSVSPVANSIGPPSSLSPPGNPVSAPMNSIPPSSIPTSSLSSTTPLSMPPGFEPTSHGENNIATSVSPPGQGFNNINNSIPSSVAPEILPPPSSVQPLDTVPERDASVTSQSEVALGAGEESPVTSGSDLWGAPMEHMLPPKLEFGPPKEFIPGVPFVNDGHGNNIEAGVNNSIEGKLGGSGGDVQLLPPDAFQIKLPQDGHANSVVDSLIGAEEKSGNNNFGFENSSQKQDKGFRELNDTNKLNSSWPSGTSTDGWKTQPQSLSGSLNASGLEGGFESGFGAIWSQGSGPTQSDKEVNIGWGSSPQTDLWGNSASQKDGDFFGMASNTEQLAQDAIGGPPPGFGNNIDNHGREPSFNSKNPPGSGRGSQGPPGFEPPGANKVVAIDDDLDPKVRKFLADINMLKYSSIFSENEIDYEALTMLGQQDLKDMGIDKKGPLLKMTQAIESVRSSGTSLRELANDSSLNSWVDNNTQ